MILCDYIIGCACGETDVVEHKLELGERPPAAHLPMGWYALDGKPTCPGCAERVRDELKGTEQG